MSKFLYITDQDEYADHSFIGPLFQKYLTKHFDINTTFFSKEKSEIEIKEDGRSIIPEKSKSHILQELEKNNKERKIKKESQIIVHETMILHLL